MLNKSNVQNAVVAFLLTLFLSFGALAANGDAKSKTKKAKTSQTSCSKTSDADIVKAIKEQFAADTDFQDQMRHLNVSVKKRIVTLEGWVDGKERVAKATAIAKRSSCVRKLISRLRESGGGSCGAGQRPCGDTCIDKRSVCNIGN